MRFTTLSVDRIPGVQTNIPLDISIAITGGKYRDS